MTEDVGLRFVRSCVSHRDINELKMIAISVSDRVGFRILPIRCILCVIWGSSLHRSLMHIMMGEASASQELPRGCD